MRHNAVETRSLPANSFKRTIIAVGGAKGGVGKTLLAANLAVYLSAQGWRAIAVDLDLGAANLHLYLGVWALKHRINDFLDRKIEDFERVAVETQYGPRLIGGGSNRLGAANLHFARKLKLMRAVRSLDADFIVLDLGGDTAFNILDFFLLADHGIVVTTCEPASYLDAYTFVKMALHRKLTRIFSPESVHRKLRDPALISLINSYVGPDAVHNDKIDDLLKAVERAAPRRHGLIRDTVRRFQPKLLVNMANDAQEVEMLVARFHKVSGSMLSIEVPFLCAIPERQTIHRSSKELVPEVARHPDGALSGYLRQILTKL